MLLGPTELNECYLGAPEQANTAYNDAVEAIESNDQSAPERLKSYLYALLTPESADEERTTALEFLGSTERERLRHQLLGKGATMLATISGRAAKAAEELGDHPNDPFSTIMKWANESISATRSYHNAIANIENEEHELSRALTVASYDIASPDADLLRRDEVVQRGAAKLIELTSQAVASDQPVSTAIQEALKNPTDPAKEKLVEDLLTDVMLYAGGFYHATVDRVHELKSHPALTQTLRSPEDYDIFSTVALRKLQSRIAAAQSSDN